jgi:hypothetical protein
MFRTAFALTLAVFMAALAASPSVGRPDDPKPAPPPESAAQDKDKGKDKAGDAKDKPADKDKSGAVVSHGFFKYRVQEIARDLKVGYCVVTADVNGDGKPDIVVVDVDRVVWYENPGRTADGSQPTWKRRTIVEHKTKLDNVSIAPIDIDGDGKIDFVLAAGWTGRFDTKTPSPLQWLRRGKSLDEPWEVHPIPCDEPTIHRVKVADLDGDGKPYVIVAPLMGRDATHGNNWMDGRPVRLLAYKVPADPVKGPWTPVVLNDSLHVVHCVTPVALGRRKGLDLLTASYEGVSLIGRDEAGHWVQNKLHGGLQQTISGPRGSSEVAMGQVAAVKFMTTVEPWHGNQIVVYTPVAKEWDRKVIDAKLRWGHAIRCADLDGDGIDEIIVGVRDDPGRTDPFPDKRGVRVYKTRDTGGRVWDRELVDEGSVAVEDLTVADLDGDGRPEIIAVGRQTGNIRIYWNIK